MSTRLVWSSPSASRARRRGPRTCCCSAARSRTWPGTASPQPSARSPSSSASIDDRARRLSVRHAAHPTAGRLVDVAVGRGARRAGLRGRARSTCPPAWRPPSSRRCTSTASPPFGLWAQVPHYVAAMSLSGCLRGPARRPRTGHGASPSRLASSREVVLQRERLDQLVESNDEHREMVARLESIYDDDDHDRRDTSRLVDASARATTSPPRSSASCERPQGLSPRLATSTHVKVDAMLGAPLAAVGDGRRPGGDRPCRWLVVRGRPRSVPAPRPRRRAHGAHRPRHGDRRRLRPQPDDAGAPRGTSRRCRAGG